jgi:hypothetical protein
MKYILALLALLFCTGVHAQDALVVQACGTLPLAYTAGTTRPLTVDVNGKMCGTGASISGPAITSGDLVCGAGVSSIQDCANVTNYGVVQPGDTTGSTTNYAVNTYTMTADAINASSLGTLDQWRYNCNYGGSNLQGNRQCIDVIANWNAPGSASNTNHSYIAQVLQYNVNAGDGGTSGNPVGAWYGQNIEMRCNAAPGYLAGCNGGEIDIVNFSTTRTKLGMAYVSWGTVNGTTIDSAIVVATANNQTASWGNAIYLAGTGGLYGNEPALMTTGCVICTDSTADTIANGIDLSALNISVNFLKSKHFVVAGPVGTTSNPTVAFPTCGTNCGILAPAANQLEFVVGGADVLDYGVTNAGLFTINGLITNGNLQFNAGSFILWNGDTVIGRGGAASFRLGAQDVASPVAQTIGVQNVVAGSANTAAANFTIQGGLSNGSGAGGDIHFKTTLSSASSGVQNVGSDALVIKGGTQLLQFGSAGFTANATSAVALTSLGPAGAHATVQEWLTVADSSGTIRYIPAF